MELNNQDLTEASKIISTEVQGLRADLTSETRRRRLSITILGIVAVLAMLISGLVGYTSYKVYDCTTPGQHCYKASLKNQAEAINGINLTTIYATVCASQHKDISEVVVCVQNGIDTYKATTQK